MTITYTATAPDGLVYTRRSSRAYTHAVAFYNASAKIWCVTTFCSSFELAEKQKHRFENKYQWQCQIVIVN